MFFEYDNITVFFKKKELADSEDVWWVIVVILYCSLWSIYDTSTLSFCFQAHLSWLHQMWTLRSVLHQ